jgi:hypothetical protein
MTSLKTASVRLRSPAIWTRFASEEDQVALINTKLRVKEGSCQVSSTGRSYEKTRRPGCPADGRRPNGLICGLPSVLLGGTGGPGPKDGVIVGRPVLLGSLVPHATPGQRAHGVATRTAIFRCPFPTEGGSRHYPPRLRSPPPGGPGGLTVGGLPLRIDGVGPADRPVHA